MSTESDELRAMRAMAWERAKGELRSMLHTFYQNGENHARFSAVTSEFIEKIEFNGLHE